MSQSISGNFQNFLSIFHAFKTISRFSGIVFAFKIISENKNPILSVWVEPEGPTRTRFGLPARLSGSGRKAAELPRTTAPPPLLGVRATEVSGFVPI
jgi:hypothetical protein